jgi:hypothetical protein
MKMRVMNVYRQWFLLVLLSLLAVVPCRAEWKLDRYEGSQTFEDFTYRHHAPYPVEKHHLKNVLMVVSPLKQPVQFVEASPTGPKNVTSLIMVDVQGNNASVNSPQISAKLSITPVYKWEGDAEPTSSFYVREQGRCGVVDDDRYNHDSQNPYTGQLLTVSDSKNGFDGSVSGGNNPIGSNGQPSFTSWHRVSNSPWRVEKIETAPGVREARGTTRTLKASMKAQVPVTGTRYYTASIQLSYQAEVCAFSLDVFTDLIEDKDVVRRGTSDPTNLTLSFTPNPRDRNLLAHANRNWTGKYDPNSAIEFFWDGYAQYTANLSSKLLETIGTPTYMWSTDVYPVSAILLSPEGVSTPQNIQDEHKEGPSTRVKTFHHNLMDSKEPSPQSSTTRLIVSGSELETGNLTAKAKIEWTPRPATSYRVETVYEVIDLDTGEIKPLSTELNVLPEEADIDAYIAEIEASQAGFFEAYTTILQTGTDVGMMVIEMVAPDPVDILTGGAGKAYDSIKAAKVLARVGPAITKIGGLMHGAVKAKRRLDNNSENVVTLATTKVVENGKIGKLPPNSHRVDTPDPDLDKPQRCYIGQFCFVAGTLVYTERGLQAIEDLKVGDKVWAKNESSGAVELKPITHTFKRRAPSTLALTFSNGERIETTDEHPFYREGDGFIPAGLLAIGNSIVTRAGPSLQITDVEKKSTPATVYNFTVAEFHTYFIGDSKLWVHNQSCSYTSPNGLVYEVGGPQGNRLFHVFEHLAENTAKANHTVFNVPTSSEIIPLLDEAWTRRGNAVPNDPGAFIISMGRTIGTRGEQSIKIVVVPGTSRIVTAYPVP